MFKTLLRTAFVLSVLASSSVTTAQQQQRQHVLAGSLTLAGYQATCGPIGTDLLRIADLAASYPGRIILGPSLFDLPRAQQIFWYMHECGHQIFGTNEAVADCWAAEQGRIAGWLSPAEFERFASLVRSWPGDAIHGRGDKRAERMKRCYYR